MAEDKERGKTEIEKEKARSTSARSASPRANRRSRSRSPRRVVRRSRSRSKSKSKSKSKSRSRSRRRTTRRSRSRSSSRGGGGGRDSDDGYRLHVADLTEECRKKDLERVFMKYGPLKEIWLASYAPFYAFIVFRHRMDAQEAAEEADGATIAGRRIRVSKARARQVGPRERFIPDRSTREETYRREPRDDSSRRRYRD